LLKRLKGKKTLKILFDLNFRAPCDYGFSKRFSQVVVVRSKSEALLLQTERKKYFFHTFYLFSENEGLKERILSEAVYL